MDQSIRDHLEATFFADYQGLRDQLLELLSDDDLGHAPTPATPTLGALCREIGEIEEAYVESFRTFRLRFEGHVAPPDAETSVGALAGWYADLDRRLLEALESITSADARDRRIVRSDFEVDEFSPTVAVNLDIYREALLIFYGKASVYLRALGRPLPPQWEHWIG